MALRRGVGFVITFIVLAIAVSVAGILFLYFAVSRGPSVPDEATLVLRPGGEIHEVPPDDVLGQIVGRDALTVRAFVDTLRVAKRDPRITGVLLLPSALDLPFWGKVQELRNAVLDFKTSGKTVAAFLEYGGEREYFLASAADRVLLLPTSALDLSGVASYEVFLRGSLDKLGVFPDFLHVGDYKTAVNTFTEHTFTPAHREMSESLNRDTYMQLVKGIASARKMTEGEVRGLLDAGPYSAEEALRVGLVDELAYADQISERVPQIHDDGDETQRIDASEYGRVDPSSVGIRTRSRIAVIYAVGAITSGESGFDNVNGARVGSGTLVEQIRRVREDESFRAVVLRIDSPGGSSVASDVIWRELALMRDARPRRPLIVSMSDLAASGGYYIAMAGDVLVAQPATLTGSIGVYTGKMVVDGTLDKIGVGVETVQSGPNANIDSPFDQFTPAQRAKVQSYIQSFYDNFIEKAATARHMTPEQVDALARGRVWTGQQAHERGLVDELGGLAEAIAIAKERAKIPADEDVEIVAYPPPRSLYETLTEQFGGQAGINVWSLWLGNAEARALAALTAPVRLFRRGEPLALMPFTFVR